MGKEFVEYRNESGTIPYKASAICRCLTQYARDYIKENRETISTVNPKVRDAVLADAINYLGTQGCCNFGIDARALYESDEIDEAVDPQCLLTVLPNHYAYYAFYYGISESVLRNNDNIEPFNDNDGALVLLDFINYISQRNDYDRRFTIRELQERAQKQKHNTDMKELKSFLEASNWYTAKLLDGESIDSIYHQMAESHDLKYISKRGIYHYTDTIRGRLNRSIMYSFDKDSVENELYAMAYAYAKMSQEEQKLSEPETAVVLKIIKEMKKR